MHKELLEESQKTRISAIIADFLLQCMLAHLPAVGETGRCSGTPHHTDSMRRGAVILGLDIKTYALSAFCWPCLAKVSKAEGICN